jgi:hypothetical protein
MRPFIFCAVISLATSLSAEDPGPVVFSELMWMGSSASSADEWIELYNRTDRSIDLAGWTITRQSGDGDQVMLQLESGQIAPKSTFLIANFQETNPRSQLANTPHLVNTAVSLSNTRLKLQLYDAHPDENGVLIDAADDGKGAPFAGDTILKKAMVRVSLEKDGTHSSSWSTASESKGWDENSNAFGTPGHLSDLLQSVAKMDTAIDSNTWGAVKEVSSTIRQ